MSAPTLSPAAGTELRALHRAILDAWNARNAAAFAGAFDEAAHLIGFDGSEMDGPTEIAATLGRIFADHPTARYVAIVREVRALGPGAAVLRAVVGMVPPGKHEINTATNAIQTLTAVERGGRWRGLLFQNTPAQYHGRPELTQQLTDELSRLL